MQGLGIHLVCFRSYLLPRTMVISHHESTPVRIGAREIRIFPVYSRSAKRCKIAPAGAARSLRVCKGLNSRKISCLRDKTRGYFPKISQEDDQPSLGLSPVLVSHNITQVSPLPSPLLCRSLPSVALPCRNGPQAWFRMVSVMRRTKPILEERRASAQTISRACTRWMALRKQERAATTVQALWRGRAGRVAASNQRWHYALGVVPWACLVLKSVELI